MNKEPEITPVGIMLILMLSGLLAYILFLLVVAVVS